MLCGANMIMAQGSSEEKKMHDEGLVRGTISIKGISRPCYFKSIRNTDAMMPSHVILRFDHTEDLFDSKIKYLPKDVFDANDKIRNSMFESASVDEIDGFSYDGRYKLVAVPNIGKEAPLFGNLTTKNVLMMDYLSTNDFAILGRINSARSTVIPLQQVASNTAELYIHMKNGKYPFKLSEAGVETLFDMYPVVLKKYKQGLYNVGRTAAENEKLLGYKHIIADRNSEIILNIVEDIVNGKEDDLKTCKRSEWGMEESAKLYGDTLFFNSSSSANHAFAIVGQGNDKNGNMMVATVTLLRPGKVNPVDFSYQVAARAANIQKDCILYSIHTFNGDDGKYISTQEIIFNQNGSCLTNGNKSFADLMELYPTLFTKEKPDMFYDRSNWHFEPLYQSYISDNKRSEISLKGLEHPTRTDRYAKYHPEIADESALRTVSIYQDEPTKENGRQYLYGYEVIVTNEKKEVVLSERIDWEFAKQYKDECAIRNLDGTPYGRILFFYTASGKKFPTDPIEQRVNFVIVPYNGTKCITGASADMRKYDRGSEKIHSAINMNGDIYILYTSYTRGGDKGAKETIEKVGFLKVNSQGDVQDLSVACGDLKEINTVIRNGDGAAQEKKMKDLNDKIASPTFTWSKHQEIKDIHETANKLYIVAYSKLEKSLPLGTTAPLNYKPEMHYGELNIIVVDKATKAIERVNTINEATSKETRGVFIQDIGGDDIQITSTLIANDSIMNGVVLDKLPKGYIRFRDGFNLLSTPHSVKIVNGVAQKAKLYKEKALANNMVVKSANGKRYLIGIDSKDRDAELNLNELTMPDIKNVSNIENLRRRTKARFLKLVPIE